MSIGSDLNARVAALEAQLQALTEQAQSDTLSPNYLTIDDQGHVGAEFTGLINALGLILPSGPFQQTPQQATDQIIWVPAGSSIVDASIQGYRDTGSSTVGLTIQSQAEVNGVENATVIRALSDPADPQIFSHSASVQISQHDRGLAGPTGQIGGWTEVDVFAASVARMIIDAGARSSWVQVGGPTIPRAIELDFGVTNVTFSGSSSSFNPTVNPDLDASPTKLVVLCGSMAGTGINGQAVVTNTNPVQFTVQGDYPFGTLTQVVPMGWIAVAGY